MKQPLPLNAPSAAAWLVSRNISRREYCVDIGNVVTRRIENGNFILTESAEPLPTPNLDMHQVEPPNLISPLVLDERLLVAGSVVSLTTMRKRSKLAVAFCFTIGLILFVTWSFRSRPAGKIWLVASSPVFGTRTNADGIVSTVSLFITNIGPRRLDYWVWWFECRERADLALLATNPALTTFGSFPLTGGSTKLLTWDLLPGKAPSQDSLFCCRIGWHESEPGLWRLGRNLEPHATRILELFDSQAVAPWNSPSGVRAKGTVFASNIGVAEYFRLAHGWTREGWLEDLRQYEMVRTQKVTYVERYGIGRGPTAEDMIKQMAKSAFVGYCQSTTNALEQTVRSAAPDATSENR